MSIIKILENIIVSKDASNEASTPEGLCPNCWGRAEYGGHFYEVVKNEKINTLEASKRLGWIQEYVNIHLSKILLLRSTNNDVVCQKCKVSYRPEA